MKSVQEEDILLEKGHLDVRTYNGNYFFISVAAFVTILPQSNRSVCSICKVFAHSGKRRKLVKCIER